MLYIALCFVLLYVMKRAINEHYSDSAHGWTSQAIDQLHVSSCCIWQCCYGIREGDDSCRDTTTWLMFLLHSMLFAIAIYAVTVPSVSMSVHLFVTLLVHENGWTCKTFLHYFLAHSFFLTKFSGIRNRRTTGDEISSKKARCSSEMKSRLWADWLMLSEELYILASCFLSLMRLNWVLEEF